MTFSITIRHRDVGNVMSEAEGDGLRSNRRAFVEPAEDPSSLRSFGMTHPSTKTKDLEYRVLADPVDRSGTDELTPARCRSCCP